MLYLYPLIQLVALVVLIELFVQCMPQALKRAARQNCYRVDGTLSAHRSYRERRARNRFRCNMIAVLVLVFLTGNALYYTVDSKCDVSSLVTYLGNRATNPNALEVNRVLGEQVKAESGSRDATAESAFDRIKQDIPWIIGVSLGWLVMSAAVVSFGTLRAYRDFAAGVNARAAEHFHLDMTRMSVTDTDIATELLQRNSSHGAA